MTTLFQILKKRELKDRAESIGVKLITATRSEDRNIVGIHVVNPTLRDIEDALETAERDLYPAIVIHSMKTWRSQ